MSTLFNLHNAILLGCAFAGGLFGLLVYRKFLAGRGWPASKSVIVLLMAFCGAQLGARVVGPALGVQHDTSRQPVVHGDAQHTNAMRASEALIQALGLAGANGKQSKVQYAFEAAIPEAMLRVPFASDVSLISLIEVLGATTKKLADENPAFVTHGILADLVIARLTLPLTRRHWVMDCSAFNFKNGQPWCHRHRACRWLMTDRLDKQAPIGRLLQCCRLWGPMIRALSWVRRPRPTPTT